MISMFSYDHCSFRCTTEGSDELESWIPDSPEEDDQKTVWQYGGVITPQPILLFKTTPVARKKKRLCPILRLKLSRFRLPRILGKKKKAELAEEDFEEKQLL